MATAQCVSDSAMNIPITLNPISVFLAFFAQSGPGLARGPTYGWSDYMTEFKSFDNRQLECIDSGVSKLAVSCLGNAVVGQSSFWVELLRD